MKIPIFFRDLLTFKIWVRNLAEFEVWNFLLFIDYSLCFLRRPKEIDKISHLIWRLLDKIQLGNLVIFLWPFLKNLNFTSLWRYWSKFFPLSSLRGLKYVCIKVQTLISNSKDPLKYVLGTYKNDVLQILVNT